MLQRIGICREEKSSWERRVPLVPEDVKKIKNKGIDIEVVTSPYRCYPDQDYQKAGADLVANLQNSDFVLGIKEIPIEQVQAGKPHLFFSHTIKGQSYNMPLLQKFLDQKATLLDYERIVNENNQRLISFSYYAGVAGAFDTLALLGKKLASGNPFSSLKMSFEYFDLAEAKQSLQKVGETIKTTGLDPSMAPFVIAVTGGGRVASGTKDVLQELPLEKVAPKEVAHLPAENNKVFMTNIDTHDFCRPITPNIPFDFDDYVKHPEKYTSVFSEYLPYLDVVYNCIYWEEKYPRLIRKQDLYKLAKKQQPLKLKIIGDISCDINGSVECTYKPSTQENPAYTYHPLEDKFEEGCPSEGVTICAIDNLPSEFPRDASASFSHTLTPFLLDLIPVDFAASWQSVSLPAHLKSAVIVWQGELAPNYRYLQNYLPK